MPKHEHDCSLVPWTLGEFGRQDVHLHSCDTARGCAWTMVGWGPICEGVTTEHVGMNLGDKRLNIKAEGTPLTGRTVEGTS